MQSNHHTNSRTEGVQPFELLRPPPVPDTVPVSVTDTAEVAPHSERAVVGGLSLPPRPTELVGEAPRYGSRTDTCDIPEEIGPRGIVSEQPSSSLAEYAGTAVRSSAMWSGAGAAVFCLESSLLAVAGHLAIGWKTLVNEVHLRRGRRVDAVSAESETPVRAATGYAGYRGLLSDALQSPAFNTLATGVCYLAASAQCALRGQFFESSILATYFVGLMAMSNVIGSSYTGTRTSTTFAEKAFSTAWRALPTSLQEFLKNPSVWLAAGNLPLVGVTCNLANIATDPLVTTPAAVGLMLSEFGLVTALYTLAKGAKVQQDASGKDPADPAVDTRAATARFAHGMLLNAAGHLLIGASSLLQGALYVGAAKMCWCVACGLLGFQMRKAAVVADT